MARTRRLVVVVLVASALAIVASTVACGSDPVGVEACKKIEHARCESAGACGINLDRPVHVGTTDVNDVASCIRYYDDACLHGLGSADPGATQVDACVNAIITGSCTVVKTPQSDPACAFLAPAAAADAAAEAAVVADTSTAADAATTD